MRFSFAVVASLKLCTMQYKNIIDTLISTIRVTVYCIKTIHVTSTTYEIFSPLKCKNTSTVSSIQFIKLMANCTFNITLFYSTIMQCSIMFYDTVLVFLHFNGENILLINYLS
jgi:hypothetical protein